MTVDSSAFDISRLDSGEFDLNAPRWAAMQLEACRSAEQAAGGLSRDEETRLRLISDMVIAANLLSPGGLPRWARRLEDLVQGAPGIDITPPAMTGPGLEFMRIEQWLAVLLSPVSFPLHIDLTMAALNDLQNALSGIRRWVLDLAAVSDLPPALAGCLIGFSRGLHAVGCDLALLWMPQSSVPEGLHATLIKHFGLQKKGAFYLSEARH